MRDKYIRKITIENFRGITEKEEIELENNKSLLIYGDNGSGKSSIIDALEFITQGNIRQSRHGNWYGNSISYSTNQKAEVTMELTDGESAMSSLTRDEDKLIKQIDHKMFQYFSYAPFILRRADVLEFWSIDSRSRLRIFMRYIHLDENIEILDENDRERLEQINNERMNAKEKRRKLLAEYAKLVHCQYEDLENKTEQQFLAFNKQINGGKQLKEQDRTTRTYQLAKSIQKQYHKVLATNAALSEWKKTQDTLGNKGIRKILTQKMQIISQDVTAGFNEISRNGFVKTIKISVGAQSEASLEYDVILKNGKVAVPNMIFSEANLDLLAVLTYLEFVRIAVEDGQLKVLALDDIFQSVDATIRFRVMQYILKRFSDWQIILTTHDRLWKEQMIQLFRSRGKGVECIDIMTWDFEKGPQFVKAKSIYDEKLKDIIKCGGAEEICAAAGYLLEYICENLSVRLNTSIKRKAGDRYTIGDLWPGIYKEIKKSAGKEIFENLNDLIYLRNIVGSHYNEWSLSLSRQEAIDFAEAVLATYKLVRCEKCGKWIEKVEDIEETEVKSCCAIV